MAESCRKFDRDFQQGAVRLVLETGKPIAQVARERGTTRARWANGWAERAAPRSWATGHCLRASVRS